MRPQWGVQRGLPLGLLGLFQRSTGMREEKALISYGFLKSRGSDHAAHVADGYISAGTGVPVEILNNLVWVRVWF